MGHGRLAATAGGRAAYARAVPQVSADTHLPVQTDTAAALTRDVPARPWHRPPWVQPTGMGWRLEPDGSGTQVVLWATYAVRPAWVQPLVHELTQWYLARQLRRRVDELTDLMRARRRD